MIRTAYLFLALWWTHHWLWNAGTLNDGSWSIWAGTLVRFEAGAHAAIEWDDEGLLWCFCWCDRQFENDEFEAWGWYAEGRLGGETTIVTP